MKRIGQEVFRVHQHVFPRNDGDGFGPARYLQKPEKEELNEIAEEITHELEMRWQNQRSRKERKMSKFIWWSEVAFQSISSWNRIVGWLKEIEALRKHTA